MVFIIFAFQFCYSVYVLCKQKQKLGHFKQNHVASSFSGIDAVCMWHAEHV